MFIEMHSYAQLLIFIFRSGVLVKETTLIKHNALVNVIFCDSLCGCNSKFWSHETVWYHFLVIWAAFSKPLLLVVVEVFYFYILFLLCLNSIIRVALLKQKIKMNVIELIISALFVPEKLNSLSLQLGLGLANIPFSCLNLISPIMTAEW